MRLYDAHNHLQDHRFGGRQAEVLAACAEAGVVRMVVNGTGGADWAAVGALARASRLVLPSFGCHPWRVAEQAPGWPAVLDQWLEANGGAVGEMGLDRWKPGLAYAGQEAAFLTQLSLAAARNRPASIHCLRAWEPLLALLASHPRPACGWVLHSFGGPAAVIPRLAGLGAYFSFPGSFLQARQRRRREAFRHVPADRLLIESDAPDQLLPPELQQFDLRDADGRVLNHPANLVVVHRELARFLGRPPEELAARLEDNFQRIFGGG